MTDQAIASELRIQLLSFEGCPLAGAARDALEAALAECGLRNYEQIDLHDERTPDRLRRWGSPTILVNGDDVAGQPQADAMGCRLYPGPSRVPEVSVIVSRIRSAQRG